MPVRVNMEQLRHKIIDIADKNTAACTRVSSVVGAKVCDATAADRSSVADNIKKRSLSWERFYLG